MLHLHGHYRRPETVILGIRDYQRQLGDAFAQAIQAFAVMDRTVVFAGFGAGLGDPNFAQLLGWFGAALGGAGLATTASAGRMRRAMPSTGFTPCRMAPAMRTSRPSCATLPPPRFPPVTGQATGADAFRSDRLHKLAASRCRGQRRGQRTHTRVC